MIDTKEVQSCTLNYDGSKMSLEPGNRYVIYLTSDGGLGLDINPDSPLKKYRITHCTDESKEPDRLLARDARSMYERVAVEANLEAPERVRFSADSSRDTCYMQLEAGGASQTLISLPDDTNLVGPAEMPYDKKVAVNQGLGDTHISFKLTIDTGSDSRSEVQETMTTSSKSDSSDGIDFTQEDGEDSGTGSSKSPVERTREVLVEARDDSTADNKLGEVAAEKNYERAIQIKRALGEGPKAMIDYIKENKSKSGLGKLLAGVLGHAVRQMMEESSNMGDLVFTLDTYSVTDRDPIETDKHDTIGELMVSLEQVAEGEANLSQITAQYGIRRAAQSMEEIGEPERDNTETTELEEEDLSLDIGLTEEESDAVADASSQATVGAATPGQEEEEDSVDFEDRQEDILEIMVKADNIDQALRDIEREFNIDDEDEFDITPEESGRTITFSALKHNLEREQASPTGTKINALKGLNNYDDRFIPVMRSLVVSEVIRNVVEEGGTAEEAAYRLGKDEVDYSGSLIGGNRINLSGDKIISSLGPDVGGTQMRLKQVSDRIVDINEPYAVPGLPQDGGIRRHARELKRMTQQEQI